MRIQDQDKRYVINGSSPVKLPLGLFLKDISLYGKAITLIPEEAKKIQELANQTVLHQLLNQVHLLTSSYEDKKKEIQKHLFDLSTLIMDLRFVVQETEEQELESQVVATFDDLHAALQKNEKITECDFSVLLEKEEKTLFCPPGLRMWNGDVHLPAGTIISNSLSHDFFMLDSYREKFYCVELNDYNGYWAITQPLKLFKQNNGCNLWMGFYENHKVDEVKESPLIGSACRSFCLGNELVFYDIKAEKTRRHFHSLVTKTEQLVGFYRELANRVK